MVVQEEEEEEDGELYKQIGIPLLKWNIESLSWDINTIHNTHSVMLPFFRIALYCSVFPGVCVYGCTMSLLLLNSFLV